MSNTDNKIQIEDTYIPDDARRVDALLNEINQMLVGDQGLMVEGALVYIANALVHSTGDVALNTKKLHDMIDRYVEVLKIEHAHCIEELVANGEQGTTHIH